MPSRRCIYCLQTKAVREFRRAEHVMPRSVGTFQPNNPTLFCVCAECNDYFGRELEDVFARDSIEALDAVQHGFRDASRYHSAGRRGSLRGRIQDGPSANAEITFDTGPPGRLLQFRPREGVVFRPSSGEEIFRTLDNLPTPAELLAALPRAGSEVAIHIPGGVDRDRALAALRERGHVPTLDPSPVADDRTTQNVEVVAQIGRPTCRLVAKVALNFLAWWLGADVVLLTEFDQIRQFARYDRGERRDFVLVDLEPILDERYVLHVIAVEVHELGCGALVTFFGRLRYQIRLSSSAFEVRAHCGRAFDPATRSILPIAPS